MDIKALVVVHADEKSPDGPAWSSCSCLSFKKAGPSENRSLWGKGTSIEFLPNSSKSITPLPHITLT